MKKLLVQMLLGLMAFSSPLSAFLGNEEGPLCECMWGVQAKGGIAPTYYSKSDHIELTIPVPSTLVVSGGHPSFSQQFNTPYDLGLEISWNLHTHSVICRRRIQSSKRENLSHDCFRTCPFRIKFHLYKTL